MFVLHIATNSADYAYFLTHISLHPKYFLNYVNSSYNDTKKNRGAKYMNLSHQNILVNVFSFPSQSNKDNNLN